MNREHPEFRKRRLIHTLVDEAAKLVLSGEFTEQGAVNAAMNTYRDTVTDQRRTLFGPVIQEVRKQVQSKKEKVIVSASPDEETLESDVFAADAKKHAEQLLAGFDGDDRPFEPAA